MAEPNVINVRVLRQARFIDSADGRIGILQLSSGEDITHFALTREGMIQLAKLLTDNADRVALGQDKKDGEEISWPN